MGTARVQTVQQNTGDLVRCGARHARNGSSWNRPREKSEGLVVLRTLQEALGAKAKQEPSYRFYLLYDKVYRDDVLLHAWALSRSKNGAPGVDGKTFADIEAYGVEKWLAELKEELRRELYKPQPVRRVMIPKASGVGERPLGIPSIRDRVAQTAAKLVLEPIFEVDFDDAAYGYRPKRSAVEAVTKVHTAVQTGHTEVVDADVSKYFDTIPHAELMKCLGRRISDGKMLHLVKMWLKVPVEERNERGGRRLTGGKKTNRGTPQGGVISPLLANIYIHRFIKAFRMHRLGEWYGAVLVNYADDFVVLCRRGAGEVLDIIRRWFTRIGLVKTALNRVLRGWAGYFNYGTLANVRRSLDWYVYERVRDFLRRRHKVQGLGSGQFPVQRVHGELGVLTLESLPRASFAKASA